KIFINGANRDPHPENSKAAILTSITYPTGGVTQIHYELNAYSSSLEPMYDETPVTLSVNRLGTTEKTFTLNNSSFVFVTFKLLNHMYAGDPTNTSVMNTMTAVLERADGTDVLKFIPS